MERAAVIIEPATAHDAERIWQLVCILEDAELPRNAFERILRHQLEDDAYCCLVARDAAGQAASGFICLRFEEQLHHAARVAQILELIVDPALRSRGTGHELLVAGRAAAQEAGCVQVELETSSWRHDAHRFYEREGMIFDHRYYRLPLGA